MAVLTLSLVTSRSSASDVDESIARIQKAYEGIRDLKGSFTQKNVIRDLNKTDLYRGEFFIKKPLKMKWAYTGKAAQDLIINNDDVLIYKKGDSQAYKSRFNRDTYGQTPVVLLTGFGNIREEFIVSGKGNSLILKPKKSMANIVSITVVLSEDDFPIQSFTIQDGRSNIVQIDLKNVQINTGLKDSLFAFSLPKGVNIYEQHQ
jgi:outer membrane lipoprotein carrier protein